MVKGRLAAGWGYGAGVKAVQARAESEANAKKNKNRGQLGGEHCLRTIISDGRAKESTLR